MWLVRVAAALAEECPKLPQGGRVASPTSAINMEGKHRHGRLLRVSRNVANLAEAVAFYSSALGFSRDVVVEVVALHPNMEGLPHVDLGYERPAGRPIPAGVKANDLLADRLVLQVDELPRLIESLSAESVEFISLGIVTLRVFPTKGVEPRSGIHSNGRIGGAAFRPVRCTVELSKLFHIKSLSNWHRRGSLRL